jgi:Dyp-type peroxidase family
MNVGTTKVPRGVLPDGVIADPNSQGLIAIFDLDVSTTAPQAQAFLTSLADMLRSLEEPDDEQNFSAAVGFGQSFFSQGGAARFGLDATAIPLGLRELPQLSGTPNSLLGDLVIYAMSRREALIAELLTFLTANRPPVTRISISRGYQRDDHREQFGFLDGSRNIPKRDRARVVTTSEDVEPDGPAWAIGGTYMSYLKVQQNLPVANQLGATSMEAAIGRRLSDGSRQDQPGHMNPHDEPDFDATKNLPAASSHVRKSGPRSADQADGNDVFIFRRGIPFTDVQADSTLSAGLHFVGFAASLSYIDVIWNHWIMNPDFPTAGAGIDLLFQNNLARPLGAGFFFIPPDDSRYLGAAIFLGPEGQVPHMSKILVRKTILDDNGHAALKSLRGFGFTLFDPNNQIVGAEFFTNSAGHALSADLPGGVALTLRETTNPPLQGQQLVPQGDVSIQPLVGGQPPTAIAYSNRFPAPPSNGYR